MNRKEYLITLVTILVIGVGLIIANAFLQFVDWIWIFLITAIGYIYLRYKISGPVQVFSNKFNMLVDYDLAVGEALELTKERVKNAPTKGIEALYMVYLGMAYYYSGDYENAIKTFNLIELKRLNNVYHVLIFAFTAYAAYEADDLDTFNLSIERIKNIQGNIHRKFIPYVSSYIQVLEAIQNLETNPEHYREVIENQFSRNDGYISTKLTYNYRMAHYYRVMNEEAEMDKCLAKVIANGQKHHTAIQAKKMFKNTVNPEDFIFTDDEFVDESVSPEEEEQNLIGTEINDVEEIEEIETVEKEDDDLFKKE